MYKRQVKNRSDQSDLPIGKDLHFSTQLIDVMRAQQAIICNQDCTQASSRTAQDICMKRITYHRNTMIGNGNSCQLVYLVHSQLKSGQMRFAKPARAQARH